MEDRVFLLYLLTFSDDMILQREPSRRRTALYGSGSKCDDGAGSLVPVGKLQLVLRNSKAMGFRVRSGTCKATHVCTHPPEAFRCRAGERTDRRTTFRPSARRKSSLFGNNDNDNDAGRSIYLEETKAPPMAIISRVYMHRSVHCSVH